MPKYKDHLIPGLDTAKLGFNDFLDLAVHCGHTRDYVLAVEPTGKEKFTVYCEQPCKCYQRLMNEYRRRSKGPSGRRRKKKR
jgi:hypothetical protein